MHVAGSERVQQQQWAGRASLVAVARRPSPAACAVRRPCHAASLLCPIPPPLRRRRPPVPAWPHVGMLQNDGMGAVVRGRGGGRPGGNRVRLAKLADGACSAGRHGRQPALHGAKRPRAKDRP